ncbi:MAG: hypothetical protein WBC51_06160 [Vicinamibacterales bacterium]
MDALVDLSWRLYPAAAIGAAGAVVWLHGTRVLVDGLLRSVWDPDKPLTMVAGFRRCVIGLAILAFAASWQWQLLWLLLLALAIGGEETLETSIIIFALRRGKRIGRRASAATP